MKQEGKGRNWKGRIGKKEGRYEATLGKMLTIEEEEWDGKLRKRIEG